MERVRHHKVKKEKAESSTYPQIQEEHDLAYYIHDRVELMHQVFSILNYKELKAMAPDCVRNLTIGDLEELCTEELLGISSKRLLAILDGVDPPSDTESSSPSPSPTKMETISLDSISSDEELLASNSKKKKHKHRHRNSNSKSKKKEKLKEKKKQNEENSELSRASRAGLTVLELLELQARARAIRAQLQQEQANKRPSETTPAESSQHSSENEVEIKEEPPDVVEISSEDEKPNVDQLKKKIADKPTTESANTEKETAQNQQTVTKRINDLVITVPQAVTTRKIRLNRNKVTVSNTNNSGSLSTDSSYVITIAQTGSVKSLNESKTVPQRCIVHKSKKKKKDKKKRAVDKDGSDHDEITLQLSDSEKMDLLEDLNESRENYDRVSSSSEDSESSSSDSGDNNLSDNVDELDTLKNIVKEKELDEAADINSLQKDKDTTKDTATKTSPPDHHKDLSSIENCKEIVDSHKCDSKSMDTNKDDEYEAIAAMQQKQNDSNDNSSQLINNCLNEESENIQNKSSLEDETDAREEKQSPQNKNNDIDQQISGDNNNDQDCDNILFNKTIDSHTESIVPSNETLHVATSSNDTRITFVEQVKSMVVEVSSSNNDSTSRNFVINDEKVMEIGPIKDTPVLNYCAANTTEKKSQEDSEKNKDLLKEDEKDLSDGELSDRQSSEVEAVEVQPEIVYISDEESSKKKHDKKKKKKTKKEKKSKKTKSDFRETSDQNFYKEVDLVTDDKQNIIKKPPTPTALCDEELIQLESDDVYEYMELSDDSSCYEVEGTVLSKEPTTQEIEALSAKIDEIERENVVTDEQIREHEQMIAEKVKQVEEENINNISWKDRYLDSKKVKKVLTTANMLNALRKKNKELKKKIQESKKIKEKKTPDDKDIPKEDVQLEEGSIEQYNTLQGSITYVDPVKEPVEENKDSEVNKEQAEKIATISDYKDVTREMKKDARQLLKMYKKLLKYNDMNMQKDPSKKKKKKQKRKDKQTPENNIAEITLTKEST